MSENRATRLSPAAEAALAFASGNPGADRRVLEELAASTIRGKTLPADLQRIANAIVAKALLEEKLPSRAPGRPIEESVELRSVECAYRYFELLDAQTPYPAQKVAEGLHMDTRQVERKAQNYKWLIGWFSEDREIFRAMRSGSDEETYRAHILMRLRLNQGRPATGGRPDAALQLKAASDLVEKLRQELAGLSWPQSTMRSVKTASGRQKP